MNPIKLRSRLRYEPETGMFFWISTNPRMIGKRAGYLRQDGYVVIKIDGKMYRAGRLAWLYVHGQWPADQIDHVNRSRNDDRIENLRECDSYQNHLNRCGAGVRKSGNQFEARMYCRHKYHSIGIFETKKEAHDAYRAAKSKLLLGEDG